uniref:Uncharacterized protein n=1 Tax=Rhizophora mucronata TaxID=61149 RepID=A0A2P2QRE3_RHIMU
MLQMEGDSYAGRV